MQRTYKNDQWDHMNKSTINYCIKTRIQKLPNFLLWRWQILREKKYDLSDNTVHEDMWIPWTNYLIGKGGLLWKYVIVYWATKRCTSRVQEAVS